MREARRSVGLLTIFADLFNQSFEFVHHDTGFADHGGQGVQILFFKIQRFRISPMKLGCVPAFGEVTGILSQIHDSDGAGVGTEVSAYVVRIF